MRSTEPEAEEDGGLPCAAAAAEVISALEISMMINLCEFL